MSTEAPSLDGLYKQWRAAEEATWTIDRSKWTQEGYDAIQVAIRAQKAYVAAGGDDRMPSCVEAWPECESGAYNPSCCRFPKSCSASSW